MLTGDSKETAQAVASKLGIDEFEAEVLPERKGEIVRNLQAHVGIAMGTGTDVAMESAGIKLVKGDLFGIVRVRRLSRMTMKNIQQNLFFSFIYNILAVPVAAGILYPFWGILLSPVIASEDMAFSSVSVIVNSLRLRKIKL